jgi:hypothetical protein
MMTSRMLTITVCAARWYSHKVYRDVRPLDYLDVSLNVASLHAPSIITSSVEASCSQAAPAIRLIMTSSFLSRPFKKKLGQLRR